MMKRLIPGSLLILLISAATTSAVLAQTTPTKPTALGSTSSYITQITPFNLVHQAYRGQFKQQGIPSYRTLVLAYRAGRIRAIDLVEGAIKANRLSPEILSDRQYLFAVDYLLRGLPENSFD